MHRRSARFTKGFNKAKIEFFSVFNPHTMKAPLASREGWIQFGSIDIGVKNFAMRVERWDPDEDTTETIAFTHSDFTKSGEEKIPELGKENFFYINSIRTLEKFCEEYLQYCQYICVESQLSFAYDNVRMQCSTLATLCIFLTDKGNRPLILDFDCKLKSKLLGAPKGLKKKKLKEWTTKKARDFFEDEEDQESLDFMDQIKRLIKDDDLGDVKCQIEALKILHNQGKLPPMFKRPSIRVKVA